MSEFWTSLLRKVDAGEMDIGEATCRDALYALASRSPCIHDAEDYVMSMSAEELPPAVLALNVEIEYANEIWQAYVNGVERGLIGPYDAVLAYYERVG